MSTEVAEEQEIESKQAQTETNAETSSDSSASELKWWSEVKQIFRKDKGQKKRSKEQAVTVEHGDAAMAEKDQQRIKDVENWWEETMGVMDEVFGKGTEGRDATGEGRERKQKSRSMF